MNVAELRRALTGVPDEMPVVLTLWTEAGFHAYGEDELEVDSEGAFLSISARREA